MLENFRLVYPLGYDVDKEVKMKNFDFIKALQIDSLVVLVKESYLGFRNISLEEFYTTDTEVLEYRLAILEDIVENEKVYDCFCKAVNMIRNIHDMTKALSSDYTVESALSSVRYLEMYQEIVEHFSKCLKDVEFKSEGLRNFKSQMMEIYNSDEYKNLCEELKKMEIRFGNIKSICLGVNLDENLRVKEAGVISIETEHYREGNIMDKLLKRDSKESHILISQFTAVKRALTKEEVIALNNATTQGLQNIFAKSLRNFEPLTQQYFRENTMFFVNLLDDIRFLTAAAKFVLSMKEKGMPMCHPVIRPMSEKKCDLNMVFNPVLAKREVEKSIVSNTFTFDENGRFYIVTGPNHGGKSIFAYSIGMAQALFQLGVFVPAESATMSPVSQIYTHFPASDENNYGKGRLESECARLGSIMEVLKDTDMLLMDESFSSTSGLEAGYIASEVLTGIGAIGCGGIYVTHIHDLPQQVDTYNSHPMNKGKIDNLVALMENKEDGTRSYKISRTTPDGLSYAKDIAARYGLHLEGILENVK